MSNPNENIDDKKKFVSENIPIPQTSRIRNDSETSTPGDEANKGQKITHQFMVSGSSTIGASPPKFVTLEEIMQAANGMTNMALVHQIAVDHDFKLNPVNLPENSAQKTWVDTMKRAYWDLLREDLNKTPPVYSHALQLIEDIKEGLFAVLLPQHTKIKQTIDEVLDLTLIKQQVEAGTLDFKHYSSYVINVMSKLCAPVRDDRIKELSETEDIVETFRGILETLDLMALDMANFTLNMARPNIIAQSVEYEREKFANFLKITPDGLENTRAWLSRHFTPPTEDYNTPDRMLKVKNLTTVILNKAYMELINWDGNNVFPETLSLDEERLYEIQQRISRLSIIGAILLISSTCSPVLQSDTVFKEESKKQISEILQHVSISNEKQLQDALKTIAELMKKKINERLEKCNDSTLNAENLATLCGQIYDVGRPGHKISLLIRNRILEFLQLIISSPTAAPEKLPPGLSSLQTEVFNVAGNFLRIVSHNRSVFGKYYIDIIDALIVPSSTNQ
ncbi:T-complex protein 11-like protein 1 [Chrysoperla carnea]|uniref:T-complex protein 11-like protein 1 n=1 Tax=Chrysoperla carnea TaxID=189513 RepID=UPI001D072AD6|nr:T-complex protein 11-like protein 1 [Chrysoperla carnea]